MSFARSRPIEPCRDTWAARRSMKRRRRGARRTASARAASASAARASVMASGSRLAGAWRSRSTAAYTGEGSMTHAGVASSYSSLPRCPRSARKASRAGWQRRVPRALGDAVEALVERLRERRVGRHQSAESPQSLCQLSGVHRAGTAHDPVRQSWWHARAAEDSVEQSSGRARQHAEPQQPLHARRDAGRIGVQPSQQLLIRRGVEVGHRRQPAPGIGAGPVEGREIGTAHELHDGPGHGQGSDQVAVTLRSTVRRQVGDLTHHLLFGVTDREARHPDAEQPHRRTAHVQVPAEHARAHRRAGHLVQAEERPSRRTARSGHGATASPMSVPVSAVITRGKTSPTLPRVYNVKRSFGSVSATQIFGMHHCCRTRQATISATGAPTPRQ